MPRRRNWSTSPSKVKRPKLPSLSQYRFPSMGPRRDARTYQGPPELGDPATVAVIRQAIQAQRPILATYDDLPRLLCPHVLGALRGDRRLLAYQIGGESTDGAIEAEDEPWRVLRVAKLEDVSLGDGLWSGSNADPFSRRQMDDIESSADAVDDAVIPDHIRERWFA